MPRKIKKNYNNLITFGYGETNPDYTPHTDATLEIYDEGFNKFMDEQHGTNLSSVAKNIVARDLGRSL